MRNDLSAIVLMVCASLGASAARAGSTADDLAQIEAQHVVLKARVRLKPAGEPPRGTGLTFSAAGAASLPFGDAPPPTMPAAEKPLPAGAPMPGRAGAAR